MNKRVITSRLRANEKIPVKARSNEGYNAYIGVAGVRFSGRPSHHDDAARSSVAASMSEPDWSKMSHDDLDQAERMARSRIVGGESFWRGVLARIQEAKLRCK